MIWDILTAALMLFLVHVAYRLGYADAKFGNPPKVWTLKRVRPK